MNGELKLISTYGWLGAEENVGADLKSVSTYGWFFDIAFAGLRIKLPTTLEARVETTLETLCGGGLC